MAAKDIEAGRAFVLLSIRNRLSQGLQDAQKQLQNYGTKIALVGAGALGAATAAGGVIGGMLAKFADHGSALNDAAARTGASAQAMSEYGYAAQMTGASLDDVEKAMKQMAKDGKSASQFDAIARSVAAIQDPTAQSQAALEHFGKAGIALLPMIRNLGELREEARDVGASMTNEQAAAADDLGDAWDRLQAAGMGIVYQLASELAPTITAVVGNVTDLIKWVRGLANDYGYLIVPVAKVLAAVGALGAALVVVGGFIFGMGAAIGAASSVLAAIFSPLGLFVAALVGLGVAAYVFRDRIRSALASVAAFFAPALEVVSYLGWVFSETFNGIVNSLQSGQLGQAAEIAWIGFQAAAWAGVAAMGDAITWALDALGAFIPGVDAIRDYLGQAFAGIGNSILAGRWDLAGAIAMGKLQLALMNAWAYIQAAWANSLFVLGIGWDSLVYGMRFVFRETVYGVAKTMLFLHEQFFNLINAIRPAMEAIGQGDFIASIAKSIDPTGFRDAINKQQAEAQANDDKNLQSKLDARNEAKLTADNERIAALRNQQAKIDALEDEAADAQAQSGINTLADKAAEAQRALEAATSKAAAGAKNADGNRFKNKAMDLGATAPGASDKISGTFSAAAALALGGGRNDAANTTAKNTGKLVELMSEAQRRRLQFS